MTQQARWAASLMLLLAAGAASNAQAPVAPQAANPPVYDPNIQRTSLASPAESPAAVVNGEAIPVGEVKKLLDARPYPVSLTEDQKKVLREAALDMLVDDVLVRQYLRKHVPQVDANELAKEIAAIKDGLKKQNKTLEQLLRESGQNEEQLRTDVAARVQWRQFVQQQCPEPALRKYYEDNKIFFDKVMVRASHILVKLPPGSTTEQRKQAQQKLQALRQELMAGKVEFAAAAKQYSDCPSKDKGGDIGPFPYKFVVVEPFARAAFGMKKGEISEPIDTEFGVHLIYVTDRTPGEPSTLEAIRDMVREMWAQDNEIYQRILADQRKASKITVHLQ